MKSKVKELGEYILIRLATFYNTSIYYLLYLPDVKKAYPNSIVEKKHIETCYMLR